MRGCYCKLADGSVHRYALAVQPDSTPDPRVFSLIGHGRIVSVDGVPQPFTEQLAFYSLRPNRPRWAR